MLTPGARAARRRRIAVRIGFVGLVVASATACIFDKGDYKGGGRNPLLTASTEADAGPTPTDTTPTPPNPPPGPPNDASDLFDAKDAAAD